ncbi:MAG: HAD hydrolase family protein, partial [Anaerolineaceae bacterium]
HGALVKHHGDKIHMLDFPEVTVAVAPDANKGHALSLICADLGIERHETLAIGDSVNDAPMLAWAGRGIALAHSDRYALDAANEVLADGDERLAEFLEQLVAGR